MADRNRQRGLVQDLSCRVGRLCSDIPGVCIVVQIIVVAAVAGLLGYLFVTRELIG